MKYVLLFMSVVLANAVFASEFDVALERAIVGDVNAQFEVGMMYERGKIVPKDSHVAQKWLESAAKRGHHEAQFELAMILAKKQIVFTKPNPEVLMWLKKSSEGGYHLAQNELGAAYAMGRFGVQRDYDLASNLLTKVGIKYQKEAIQGNAKAQLLWGEILIVGNGKYVKGYEHVDDDLDEQKGMRWLLKSAEQGNPEAMFLFANYTSSQNDLIVSMGDMVLESRYKEALKWNTRAAEKEHPIAILNLSYAYEKGRGVSIDLAKAFQFDMRGALLGNAESQFNVAEKYSSGSGVNVDINKAYIWALLANKNNHQVIDWERTALNSNYVYKWPARNLILKLEALITNENKRKLAIKASICFESLYQECPKI